MRAPSWRAPTSTEIGTVAKSGLAAGLAWWVAYVVVDVPSPVLASLTAIVVVQVSVRASVSTALQRSAAVVLGVLAALAIGDALELNALTVALVVTASLAVAELVLRLPRAAARQVPVSVLVVLSAVAASPGTEGWRRALDTVIGAAVGVVISLLLPASRLVDARQSLERLGDSLGTLLEAMATGLHRPWSTDQTEEWRRTARTVRRGPGRPGGRGRRQRPRLRSLERARSTPHRRARRVRGRHAAHRADSDRRLGDLPRPR